MNTQEVKETFKKVWNFLWHDNSIWSWIANVILSFLLIKYIVYPVLGLLLATTHPIVAVVSGSMEHDGSFSDWWNSKCCQGANCETQAQKYASMNIDEQKFKSFSLKNGFNKGDLMILSGAKNLKVGDVVVFNNPKFSDPIIHRIISTDDSQFTTKGDHNCGSADFEYNIPQDRFIGKAVLRVPVLGWIKVGFVCTVLTATGRADFIKCMG